MFNVRGRSIVIELDRDRLGVYVYIIASQTIQRAHIVVRHLAHAAFRKLTRRNTILQRRYVYQRP